MANSLQSFLNPYQKNLNSWFPSCPQDALYGGAKSIGCSFVVSLYLSQGNMIAGLRSAGFAATASVIHSIVTTFLNAQGVNKLVEVHKLPGSQYYGFLGGLASPYLIRDYLGASPDVSWTVVLSALSYFITGAKDAVFPITPLFATIVTTP
jgi:hypothetical protein